MKKQQSAITAAYLVPGLPHILLGAERSSQWEALRRATSEIQKDIAASGAEVILYFSTQWFSVLGTMVQGSARMQGRHVDSNWHQFGTMSYDFPLDTQLAQGCGEEISALGVTTKLIDYAGFPLDTGTIVAQSLINPEGRLPACIVSCNIYANEAEVERLGQACRQAVEKSGKKVAVVLISSLSQRFHTVPIDPREDHISSAQDEQWNRRILGLLEKGALEEVVTLCPSFAKEASADLGFKGACWLQGVVGRGSISSARIDAYQPVWGSGAAVCRFTLQASSGGEKAELPTSLVVDATRAPAPVGAYPHARRLGNVVFLSGIGPRLPAGGGIAGVEWDSAGRVAAYDISLQTRQVFANVEAVLAGYGCTLASIVDIQVFLTNMAGDFADFNRVYGEYFDFESGPCRTTVEVGSLPTPIAVEFKVIAALA